MKSPNLCCTIQPWARCSACLLTTCVTHYYYDNEGNKHNGYRQGDCPMRLDMGHNFKYYPE